MFGTIIVAWSLWFGAVPTQDLRINDCGKETVIPNSGTVAGIGLTAKVNRLKLFTNMESFQKMDRVNRYMPYRIDYSIGAEVEITKNIAVVVQHECDHSVVSDMSLRGSFVGYNETKAFVVIYGGGPL